jgi:argininosuccinate lyase
VYGHLMGLLTLMKGQPLAYNKDNQEDKEPLFDTVDTLVDTLRIFADMAGGITVKPENMRAAALQGYATATDLADYLVKKGLPFRDAHEAVAHAVRACDDLKIDLAEMSLEQLRAFSTLIEDDVFAVLTWKARRPRPRRRHRTESGAQSHRPRARATEVIPLRRRRPRGADLPAV